VEFCGRKAKFFLTAQKREHFGVQGAIKEILLNMESTVSERIGNSLAE